MEQCRLTSLGVISGHLTSAFDAVICALLIQPYADGKVVTSHGPPDVHARRPCLSQWLWIGTCMEQSAFIILRSVANRRLFFRSSFDDDKAIVNRDCTALQYLYNCLSPVREPRLLTVGACVFLFTIRYDSVNLTCSEKLTGSQLTARNKQKNKM